MSSPRETSPSNPRTTNNRVRTRGITRITWSVAEKEIIYSCLSYSRSERWGRNKTKVFQEKLGKSSLDQRKLEQVTIAKLNSLMSQIGIYIGKERLKEIENNALQEAENDYAMETSEQRGRRKEGWLLEEKWTLLWATIYAKTKHGTNKSPAYTKTWRSIMEKYCPSKRDHQINTTQLNNVKTSGVFSEHTPYLMEKIKLHIEQGVDPLITPIQLPRGSSNRPLRGSNGTLTTETQNATTTETTSQVPTLPSNQPLPDNPTGISSTVIPNPTAIVRTSPSPIVVSPPVIADGGSTGATVPTPAAMQNTVATQTPTNGPPPLPMSNRPPSSNNQPRQTLLLPENPILDELAKNIEAVRRKPIQEREPLKKIFENVKFKTTKKVIDDALPNLIHRDATLTEINQVHYAAALTIQNQILPQKPRSGNLTRPKRSIPSWKRKLTEQISRLRAEASRLHVYLGGTSSRRLHGQIRKIRNKYNISTNEELASKLTEIKMLITTKAKIIKNKEEKILCRNQNKQFEKDPKRFFESLDQEKIEVKQPPPEEQLSAFWRGIYEDGRSHNENASWIAEVEDDLKNKPKMKDSPVTETEFNAKLRRAKNFKSPGPDQITNFWLKQITALHPLYRDAFNRILSGRETAPLWLTEGMTRLLPKSAETNLPNKYRPICCLPTTYKLLTGIISERLYAHLDTNNLLSPQQKGCIRDSLGTKDQLLLNKAVLENCRKRATNLSMAWLDYQKAYDSVPHSWIKKCLKMYGVSQNIENFISDTMTRWNTNLHLRHEKGEIVVRGVKIKRGIFQGDSLSPLLFCLSIDPLSRLLNLKGDGYNMNPRGQVTEKVGHLLYMDDLKLYASNDNMLTNQLKIVKKFSTDITMKFGLDKCATVSIEKGKFKKKDGFDIQDLSIRTLQEDETYKYLGIEETNQIDHAKMRKMHKDSYIKALKMILKTKLSAKNKILAINMMIIPKIQYSFGIIEWPQHQINQIDILTRKLLAQNKIFYKDQCHARLYVPRAKGGMGLIEVDASHKATIVSLGQYIVSGKGPYAEILKKHYSTSTQTSLVNLAQNFLKPEKLEGPGTNPTKAARKSRRKFVQKRQMLNVKDWKDNKRAGRFAKRIEDEEIDRDRSFEWLKRGVLKFDGERIILTAQDGGLLTNYLKKLFKMTDNDKCRFCHDNVETVDHLLSGCLKLMAEGWYTTRHNKVCRVIHWRLCQEYGFNTHDVSWKHEPQSHMENHLAKITYDAIIPTSRHIPNGAVRPDIFLEDKSTRKGYIIDVCVPNDYRMGVQEQEKVSKYQHLKNAIADTYNLNPVDIIPVVMGATGMMKKNLQRYIQRIPGKITNLELQIEVVKETVSMLKRALGCSLAT